MAESLTLPLRLPTSKSNEKDSLETRISQIFAQKGAFRHVTEASLIREIELKKDDEGDTKMAEADAEEADEPPEDRQQMIGKAREDMMQQLR
jgi:Subunit 17 of Mediator complex